VARFGNVVLGGFKYGATPKLNYSVEPFELTVLTFTSVYLAWQSPKGTFTRIRLVRNQNGYPEHAEDGIVVWEEAATEGTVSISTYTDGVDNPFVTPIVSGLPVYYRMFLFTGALVWRKSGSVTDIIPSNHGAQLNFMNLIPKVFTSAIQSPLGVTDSSSTIYDFIDGISFTYEQLLTAIDLIKPTPVKLLHPVVAL